MSKFAKGQRWINSASPELGPGIVLEVDDKTVSLFFEKSETHLRYSKKSSPLIRSMFLEGDLITTIEGKEFTVEKVEELENGLLLYHTESEKILESQILSTLNINHPEEKLLNGISESLKHFHLRIETLKMRSSYLSSPSRGMFGGRVALFAHQIYVVDKICKDFVPHSLLADEVGLGKTVEAGLAIHRLLVRNIIDRVLIILPDSLVVQWYLELIRKFNLKFSIINQETPLEKGINPFMQQQLVIVGINFLKGSPVAKQLVCEASWDLIVYDEAHALHFEEEESNFEYNLVKDLLQKASGALFLTATPEEKGEKQLFSLLNLLDNHRYPDISHYLNERKNYHQISEKVSEILEKEGPQSDNLQQLVDCYGTGKAYIRNFRSKMEKEFSFFPKRILHQYPLESKKEDWLISFLKDHLNEKILLIAHSKETILYLEKVLLKEVANVKLGLFHSGLGLAQRDRQAAYFADPKGAQILLCTEIGSEGRNFEFCSHLLLFDLPLLPGLLEQRIGRLDRIGQKKDVQIHVPYVKGLTEELRFRFFHEGLNAFCKFSSSGTSTYALFHKELNEMTDHDHSFFERVRKKNEELMKELEEGRDLLLELNSFDDHYGHKLVRDIQKFEQNFSLKNYMEEVFDSFGVTIDDLNSSSYFLYPSPNMIVPHFPGLDSEGTSVTYERDYALVREDIQFMSWDHPMAIGSMDLILSEKIGNVCVCSRKEGKGKKTFVECFYVWEWVNKEGDLDRFFPPQLFRVLCDFQGENFGEKWSKEFLDEKVIEANTEIKQKVYRVSKSKWAEILKKARTHAELEAEKRIKQLCEEAIDSFEKEKMRIEILEKISERSFATDKNRILNIITEIKKIDSIAGLNLDSFRVIV